MAQKEKLNRSKDVDGSYADLEELKKQLKKIETEV